MIIHDKSAQRRINSLSKLVDEEGYPRTDIDIVDVIERTKQLKGVLIYVNKLYISINHYE